ncbi:MAG: hypothetical protein ACP5VS_10315 [Desulfomonilaceae bacterium]
MLKAEPLSRGGRHIGTIWGHGSYRAPDWSADFLLRMSLYLAARLYGLNPDKPPIFHKKISTLWTRLLRPP